MKQLFASLGFGVIAFAAPVVALAMSYIAPNYYNYSQMYWCGSYYSYSPCGNYGYNNNQNYNYNYNNNQNYLPAGQAGNYSKTYWCGSYYSYSPCYSYYPYSYTNYSYYPSSYGYGNQWWY